MTVSQVKALFTPTGRCWRPRPEERAMNRPSIPASTLLPRIAGLLALVLGLAGCVTPGYGGYPGQGYPVGGYPPASQAQRLAGTVADADPANRRFLLDDETGGYGQRRVEIRYDDRTRLTYRGQLLSPAGLEPGDRIEVDASRSGDTWWARSIEVIADVRGGQDGYGYGNALGGAVTYVDTRARVIGFTQGGYAGSQQRVRYDGRTVVEYRGQRYRIEDLERGDVIRIEAQPYGNEWLAQRIVVEVDARSR